MSGGCGSRWFNEPGRAPRLVNVKAGTLDDTSWLRPIGHLWLSSAQPWFQAPEDTLCYPAQPRAFDDLIERFQAAIEEVVQPQKIEIILHKYVKSV